jgi:serine/threonine protein phosphatase 1
VERAYAIGDVHGHLDALVAAHERIRADRRRVGDESAPVIHLGDHVDRGPESAEVVEFLLRGPAGGARWINLRGNHDQMFLDFLGDPESHDPDLRPDYTWLHKALGGTETLASYGVIVGDRPLPEVGREALARVPAAHRAFLDGLLFMHRTREATFVHAGIRPGLPLDRQMPRDLVWIRKGFLEDRTDHGPLVIHGHTVVDEPSHFGNRVDIDTGAAYGGPLTAIVVEGREVFVLTEDGRRRLEPGAARRLL